MESQKIINLLNSNNNDSQKFATKRWYIIQDQNNGEYGNAINSTSIKYDTKVIKSNLCDYSDAYILVTGNIENTPNNSTIAFKNCAPFQTCNVNINDECIEAAKYLDIIMPMYNLLEYSDNYEDTTGSLYQFKREEPPDNNGEVTANTASLKYKSISDDNNVKLVVPLKYISNFFRSLEMPLVNCKVDLDLTWTKDCAISSNNAAANTVVSFKITDTKLYVPIVTLLTKDNTNLTKQLNEGFKRTVYWNEYKAVSDSTATAAAAAADDDPYTKTLDASFQGVNRLFVLAFAEGNNNPTRSGYRRYYLPRIDITKYNVLIDGRNFYDQPINDKIRQYDKIRKVATGKGDNYATGCLLGYKYFKDFYKLVATDLSKQKELDADPRAIQQIEFYGKLSADAFVLFVLEKSKETVLEFYKGTAKVM